MKDRITELLESLREGKRDSGKALEMLLDQDPLLFLEKTARFLLRRHTEAAERFVIYLLKRRDKLTDLLLDSRFSNIEEAVALASIAKKNLDFTDIELARRLKTATDEEAMRILRLLAEIANNNRTLPLLTSVLRMPNPKLRAHAATIFGQYCSNELFIQSAIRDPDPEVRAFVIEGAGIARRKPPAAVLSAALIDSDPRVAASAALAAYRFGEPGALQMLLGMAGHADARYRQGAARAMAESGDGRFQLALEKLSTDTHEEAAMTAAQGLERLRQGGSIEVGENALVIDVIAAEVDDDGQRGIRLNVLAAGNVSVDGLSDVHIAVTEGGRVILDHTVTPPDRREPISMAFVLENSGSMSSKDVLEMNGALLKVISRKRNADRCTVVKYSRDIESAVKWSADLGALGEAIRKRHFGLRTGSRLFDGVASALEALSRDRAFGSVIVICDSADEGSSRQIDEVIQLSLELAKPVHLIAYQPTGKLAMLQRLAAESGGTFQIAETSERMTQALRSLYQRISNCYLVSYRRPEPPASTIQLQVACDAGAAEIAIEMAVGSADDELEEPVSAVAHGDDQAELA